MKKDVFVFISTENIKIISDKLCKDIDFKEKEIRNVNAEVIGLIIKETLCDLSIQNENLILVLSSEFILCSEKITANVKKQQIQENSDQDLYNRVVIPNDNIDNYTVRQVSKYIFNGKSYDNSKAIPLLQRFFINKQISEFDRVFISQLLSSLQANDLGVKGIIPFVSLYQCFKQLNNQNSRKIVLSFNKDNSIASVIEDGIIIKNIIVNNGLNKIIEDVSNTFDLSSKTTETLIEKYGFVFLPKEYINYVIDIPVYGKLMQSVGLIELSFSIRESLKVLYNDIISSLSLKMKDYEINSDFVYVNSFNINGDNTLLNLIINKEIFMFDWNSIEYSTIVNVYTSLNEADQAEKFEYSKIESEIPELQQVKPAFVDKLTNIFNSKIKPYLVDPEV